MNCLDCALQNGDQTTAFGICRHCGAAICLDHATVVTPRATPVGLMPTQPQRRTFSCLDCTPRPQGLAPTARIVGQRSAEVLAGA